MNKRVDSILYEVRCGRVAALSISAQPSPDYDADALKAELLTDLQRARPKHTAREGGKIFNTYYATFNEAEAFTLARKQVVGYREWLRACTDIADALSRDLT